MQGKFRNDLLLIAVLLLAAAGLALLLFFTRQAGGIVRVVQDGVTIAQLPLDTDTEHVFEDAQGGRNTLVIQGGAAWVSEADCPDQICKKHGAIRWKGQSIVCLPHRLVISIEGGEDGGFDAQTR